jgi:hypothetical protein
MPAAKHDAELEHKKLVCMPSLIDPPATPQLQKLQAHSLDKRPFVATVTAFAALVLRHLFLLNTSSLSQSAGQPFGRGRDHLGIKSSDVLLFMPFIRTQSVQALSLCCFAGFLAYACTYNNRLVCQ